MYCNDDGNQLVAYFIRGALLYIGTFCYCCCKNLKHAYEHLIYN